MPDTWPCRTLTCGQELLRSTSGIWYYEYRMNLETYYWNFSPPAVRVSVRKFLHADSWPLERCIGSWELANQTAAGSRSTKSVGEARCR